MAGKVLKRRQQDEDYRQESVESGRRSGQAGVYVI
jgi:hypothetical protein